MEQTNEKKCFVHIEHYTGEKPIEIIYREDEPAKHLDPIPVKMPSALDITGTIATVQEFLQKRMALLNIDNCRLVVNRDESTLALIINETDSRPSIEEWKQNGMEAKDLCIKLAPKSTVSGQIEFTEMYSKLKINADYWWSPVKLSKFLRLNRVVFGESGKEDGMALVSALKNVKAKINSDYEKKKELHGQISKTEYFSQEVSHNLPEKFTIELSIFKGAPKEKYEIEIDADIVDGEIQVQLLSPAVNENVETARDILIDNEVDAIKTLCPNLVIVEE